MILVAILLGLLLGYWIFENLRHTRNVSSIPTRILVTGTRGKSSITRLIAAGLKSGGITTAAKTTGSSARFIAPDGTETPVKRRGIASILEQIQTVRNAVRCNAKVLVVEAMALRPQLMQVEVFRLIRPNLFILSNIRSDHLDITGNSPEALARAFSHLIPVNGILFTAETTHLPVLMKKATAVNCKVKNINPLTDTTEIPIEKFSYIEHPENVALALEVCEHLGVERSKALTAMFLASPDPGALQWYKTTINNFPVTFIQAFAANDAESLLKIKERINDRLLGRSLFLIINLRGDRPHRTEQMAELVPDKISADRYIISGSGFTSRVKALFIKAGILEQLLVYCADANSILEEINEKISRETVILGIGNFYGTGEDITNYFKEQKE